MTAARRRLLLGGIMVALGAALIAVVLRSVDVAQVGRILMHAPPLGVAALVAFSLTVWLVLPTWRWQLVLGTLGVRQPFARLLRVRAGAQPLKLVVPFRGGEAVRAVWLVQNAQAPLAVAATSVVFDMGLVALGQLGLAAVAFSALSAAGVAAALALVVAGALAMGSSTLHRWGLRFIQRPAPRLAAKLAPVADALAAATPRRKAALVGLTLLTELPEIVSLWAAFAVAGADVPVGAVAVGLPLVVAATLLPVSIGGFGPRELTIASVFASWAPAENIAAGALLFSAVEFVLPALLGLLATPRVLGELSPPSSA